MRTRGRSMARGGSTTRMLNCMSSKMLTFPPSFNHKYLHENEPNTQNAHFNYFEISKGEKFDEAANQKMHEVSGRQIVR